MLCDNIKDLRGGFYRMQNQRMVGLDIPPLDYGRVRHKMDQVYGYLEDKNMHPICKALKVHYDIIAIQPFEDYNKRTARMIMNWVLMQNGYTPILFNVKGDRDIYLDALNERNRNQCAYDEIMLKCLARTQDQIIALLGNKAK